MMDKLTMAQIDAACRSLGKPYCLKPTGEGARTILVEAGDRMGQLRSWLLSSVTFTERAMRGGK